MGDQSQKNNKQKKNHDAASIHLWKRKKRRQQGHEVLVGRERSQPGGDG